MDILTAVLQAPVNTILIIAGAAILFFALFEVGKGAVRLRTGKANVVPIAIGAVLIIGGLLYKPQSNSQEESTLQVTIKTQTPLPPVETPSTTPELSTPSPTIVLSSSPTPIPVSLTCLDGWDIVNTADIEIVEDRREGCARSNAGSNTGDLALTTNDTGLVFTLARFRKTGIFGLTTPLAENAIVGLKLTSKTLFNAEFWVALSNSPLPQSKMLILALEPATQGQTVQSGNMLIYLNQSNSKADSYDWLRLNPANIPAPPFSYDILLKITGGNVEIRVNDGAPLDSQIVNFPRYLFIGFRDKTTNGSVTMNVNVSDLKIEAGQ